MAGVPVLHSVDAGNDPVAESRLRPDRGARGAGCRGRRAAPAGGAERRRTPRDGRARPRSSCARTTAMRCWRGASSRRWRELTPSRRGPDDALAERYARRGDDGRYSPLRPDVWQTLQERQRAMLGLFAQAGLHDLSTLTHAGGGLRRRRQPAGAAAPGLCSPEHLSGVELLPERLAQARARAARGRWRCMAAMRCARRVPRATLGHRAACPRCSRRCSTTPTSRRWRRRCGAG